MEIELKENERIDDLECKGIKIIQNTKGFCFGIDSVLLSDFAKGIQKDSVVMDMGTGSGVIASLLCAKTSLKKIIGIEIQKDICEMAKRSILMNNLQDKFEIINENIKNLDKIFQANTVDAIVTNPPYKEINTGIVNDEEAKYIARHEIECNLEDIIKQSSYLLKNKCSIYMVHRPERLADIFYLLRKYKLEPKICRFVQGYENKKPNLVLIKAVKNANVFLEVKDTLIVYNQDGSYKKEILEIYGKLK